MEKNQQERDVSGNNPNSAPLKGSYADYRADKLREWRKMFNVDNHGFYKGGGIFIRLKISSKTRTIKYKRKFYGPSWNVL